MFRGQNKEYMFAHIFQDYMFAVSVLGQEEGYMVKYTPLSEGVPKGKARGNS